MTDLPIACTLSADELTNPSADLLPALVSLPTSVRVGADSVALEFRAENATLDRLSRIINRERTCCAFLRFTLLVPPGGAEFQFTVDGPPGTGALLASLHPAFAAGKSDVITVSDER